ncbi:MAG: phosphoribosyltransferase [Pseudanabaenaceae cyanobacterium SKYGB_i_bin29]|nr:phosphoribosyltransferase [Pseudanabaenaceae cyanobacterium SKYG29]MDW8422078.1 phosphoribosyltransferase [Pseudanabaenaceae cyanobacterium SKYGB_i_bin29]
MSSRKVVSWSEYHCLIEKLAYQVHRSGYVFNGIICLARGGLRVGDTLSRIFHCPLAILATSSYRGQQRGELIIANSITMTTPTLPDRLLLVDDLVDSGETIMQTLAWLKSRYRITEMRTAVLWYKSKSKYRPDYFGEVVSDNVWIEQPFEAYENFQFTDSL